MIWRPIIATTLAVFLYRAAVHPGRARYRAWKASPRERVARRNWRGVYVPDLTIIRLERLFGFAALALFVFGGWIMWAIMVPSR